MLDFEHIETLEEMANILKEEWDTENFLGSQRTALIQTYAQVCTTIVQGYQHWQQVIAEDEIFLQIGTDILRKSDIIRVESEDSCDGNPKQLKVYTRDIVSAGEDYGSCTSYRSYEYDSPEAQMFLHWLKGKTETLKDPSKCISCGEPIEEQKGLQNTGSINWLSTETSDKGEAGRC